MADATTLERLFFDLLEGRTASLSQEDFAAVVAGATQLRIYIPNPPINSSISTSYMRAFIELQAQLNTLAAKARGKPNATGLTRALKEDLELNVVVEDGSAQYLLDFVNAMQKAIGKMNGKQAQQTIVAVALLLGLGWGATTWMEVQRQVQLEQLRTQEHIHALDALKFATSAEVDSRNRLIEALVDQVELGKEVVELADSTMRAVMKATATGSAAEINGQPVSSEVADLLTISPRSELVKVQENVLARVIDINTEDVLRPVIEMQEADAGKRFRFRVEDDLFAADQRAALFDALETGALIQVRVELTKFGDDVRSVEFVTLP